jgi:hypothetical protein
MKLKIDEENGFQKFEGTQRVETTYPYRGFLAAGMPWNGTFTVNLEGYEEVVIEMVPERTGDLILGGGTTLGVSQQPVFSPATLKNVTNSLELRDTVEVPLDGPKARLAVLLEPDQEIREIKADATDDGKPLALSTENGEHGIWHWFYADLTPGKHSIVLTIHSAAPSHLSTWLLTQREHRSDGGRLRTSPDIERGTHLLLEETIR